MSPQILYRTIILSILVLSILAGGLLLKTKTEKELEYQRKRLVEFNELIVQYRGLKEEIARYQKGISSTLTLASNKENLINNINSLINQTGLKERIKTLKQNPQKKETIAGLLEEAELELQRITMNEFANLLYQIEGNAGLSLSRVSIKRSFENPELLNISLIISSLTTKEK